MNEVNKLVLAHTRFGFDLLAEILKRHADENVFVSPSSVAFALAMTYNGARGTTRRAMAKALTLQELPLQELNQANAALRLALTHLDPQVRLNIANSLWAKEGIPFIADFMQRNQDYYGAHVAHLNFQDPDAPTTINAWVSEKTEGKIDTIVSKINPLVILLLINAIYFKGEWAHKFEEEETVAGDFFLLDGGKKTHPMMTQRGRYDYYRGKGFQALSLPYGKGRVSMYVFLPDENSGLAKFQKALTAGNWEEWMAGFRQVEGQITLPRFRLEYRAELNAYLKALGMAVAFDALKADFGGMCPIPPMPNVYIGRVIHKAFVEVNEEGTEAAAATRVTMVARSARMKTFRMIVDRPFFCAIRDNETETVLFLGTVVDPL